MKIRFLNLSITNTDELKALLGAVERVFHHGIFINGPELEQFEGEIAGYCRRKFAVGVNSGTDALFVALKALGIGPGDEVITTAFSWVATANAIAMCGAEPVFADIGDHLNIDPDSIESLITPKTRALMPVHYSGLMCRMDQIQAIADRHDLVVIEDASQAIGANYADRCAGSFGHVSCASLNPMKLLAACGEAGVILTDDSSLREKLVAFRYNGMINKEVCRTPGLNARMDTLQAALLLERLKHFDENIDKRIANAAYYNQHLCDDIGKPVTDAQSRHIYFNYIIRARQRDSLEKHLMAAGIEVKKRDPDMLPFQPAYKNAVSAASNAKKIYDQLLCLPVHEKLTEKELAFICERVNEFFA